MPNSPSRLTPAEIRQLAKSNGVLKWKQVTEQETLSDKIEYAIVYLLQCIFFRIETNAHGEQRAVSRISA